MVSPRRTYSSFAISAPPTVRIRPRAVSVTITGRPANNDLPGFHVHSDDLALYLGNDSLCARGPDDVIPHLQQRARHPCGGPPEPLWAIRPGR